MNGRQIVVTGGSSGIGLKICERLAANDDHVHVLDRNPAPGTVQYTPCDLTNPASVQAAVAALPGTVDVLINAAGVSGLAGASTTMTVNFFAVRDLTTAVAPRMPRGSSVVNIASTSGWYWREHLADIREVLAARTEDEKSAVISSRIPDGYTAYARSKEAVIVWSAVASQQYLGHIRVNSISPGPIETPLLKDFYEAMGHDELDPLTARSGGRNGRPEEVAAVAVWLASPDAYWVNGTDIPVDHGAEMAEFLAAQDLIAPLAQA